MAKRFRDAYSVGDKLGEGAFGVVHRCVNKATKEKLAVKMIDKSYSDQATVDRELEIMEKVKHECCNGSRRGERRMPDVTRRGKKREKSTPHTTCPNFR